MVGRRSGNRCDECRRRKIKCDGRQPSCSQCTRATLACPGYRVFWDFRDAQGRRVPSPGGPSSAGAQSSEITPGVVLSSSNLQDPSKLVPGGESVYQDAFINVLNDRFFFPGDKNFSAGSDNNRSNICSGWIGSAMAIREDKTILSEILLALSSLLVGVDLQNPAITGDSRRRYQKVINGIRGAIDPSNPTANASAISEAMLLACMACAKYELLANLSLLNMSRHMSGLGALFHRRGIAAINTTALRELYSEFRPVELSICLTVSRDSVFSSTEWRSPPWKVNYSPTAAPLQELLDIAFGIPPLLEKWRMAKIDVPLMGQGSKVEKRLSGQNEQPIQQSSMQTSNIEILLSEISRIYKSIEAWHTGFLKSSRESMQISLIPATWNNGQLDAEELAKGRLFSATYAFSHFPIGMASIYFDGIRLQLLKNIDEMCAELGVRLQAAENPGLETLTSVYVEGLALLQSEDVVTSVTRVLQCAEYFLGRDKKLLGPTAFMFAFHVSFSALCRLGKISEKGTYQREIRWCRLISEKYEEARLASLISLDIGDLVMRFLDRLASDDPDRRADSAVKEFHD